MTWPLSLCGVDKTQGQALCLSARPPPAVMLGATDTMGTHFPAQSCSAKVHLHHHPEVPLLQG